MNKLMMICCCLAALAGNGQATFRTIVTRGPIVAGEPFQVQYVLADIDDDDDFIPPSFQNFKFISGPNTYGGSTYGSNGPIRLRNIVYTLVATRAGKFIVPGASAKIDGQLMKSEPALLEVISRTDAIARGIFIEEPDSDADYLLHPGEDPEEKIRRNLFLKVMVDKKSCYVGEPITATFKLYSRLRSKSDIIKNPGFYGFTVQDMIGLGDKLMNPEVVGGKTFDVHTLRKVQLYPLGAGSFTIDPLEVQNKVEFSQSEVNKRIEQEVIEGVVPDNDKPAPGSAPIFESSMSTEPIVIRVKPLPTANRPDSFDGATGHFRVETTVQKKVLAKNEEGIFTVTVSGRGNFIQLSAPTIAWPAGIEGFDPEIRDSLDHTQSPLHGERVFRYRFISSKAGTYVLPALDFSFFDPDSNRYKSVRSLPVTLSFTAQERNGSVAATKGKAVVAGRQPIVWWVGSLVLLSLITAAICWLRKKRKTGQKREPVNAPSAPGIEELLQPVTVLSGADDRFFYTTLRGSIWKYLQLHFGLSGSRMSKQELADAMHLKNVDDVWHQEMLAILEHCETGMFTQVETSGDKQAWLERTRKVLTQISGHH